MVARGARSRRSCFERWRSCLQVAKVAEVGCLHSWWTRYGVAGHELPELWASIASEGGWSELIQVGYKGLLLWCDCYWIVSSCLVLNSGVVIFLFFPIPLPIWSKVISLPEVPRDLNYNRDMALASMVLQDDIFMIWALKSDILINWPYVIMQNMLKCNGIETGLPYGILITAIMQYAGVDLSVDTTTTISLRYRFSVQNLKKLNIVHVNGQWQHLRVRNDDATQGIEQSPMDEDSDDEENDDVENMVEPSNPTGQELLTQIWGGVQQIEARLQTLTIDVERRFSEVNSTVNEIYHLRNRDDDSDE
ncbi:hypothetical protein DEO72_LG6g1988 [Vigna unguiculata]|uniref:Uncharacterized protein n=1 Tax=Vigna unguiculata TaxID=3917 RepID=A0A4D6MA56_VIGUN|nr:hypothetical protein DEO72_LG6g1988 [Vigna unguiculata]